MIRFPTLIKGVTDNSHLPGNVTVEWSILREDISLRKMTGWGCVWILWSEIITFSIAFGTALEGLVFACNLSFIQPNLFSCIKLRLVPCMVGDCLISIFWFAGSIFEFVKDGSRGLIEPCPISSANTLSKSVFLSRQFFELLIKELKFNSKKMNYFFFAFNQIERVYKIW